MDNNYSKYIDSHSKCQNRSVNEIFTPLTFYAVQIGSLLPSFRDNLSVAFSWTAGSLKIGFDRLSRNVGKTTILRFVKSQNSEDPDA